MKIFPTTADFVVFTKVYTNEIDPETLYQIEEDGLEYYGMISDTQYHPQNNETQLKEIQSKLNLPPNCLVFENEDNYPIGIPHLRVLMEELNETCFSSKPFLGLSEMTEINIEKCNKQTFLIIKFYKN